MDKLPQELLVEVLKHLPPTDLMTCAALSRGCAEALTYPQLLEGVWFTIRENEVESALPVLLKSSRRYRNLKLVRVPLYEFDSEFWGKFGGTLRRLALDGCHWMPGVLYGVLRECSGLEYLRIQCNRVWELYPGDSEACGTSIEDVRESLSNVQHLHLRTTSTKVLGHLLDLMSNVSSISLQIISREFNWSTLIHQTLTDHRIVTELDLVGTSVLDAELIEIMEAFSEGLRELRLNCMRLTRCAVSAIGGCSRLRLLLLDDFRELGSTDMTEILRSNPGLEMLDLICCTSLTDDGLSSIHELRNLRRLNLYGCQSITNEFLSSLGGISTLEYLDLSCTQLDSETIQSIACLGNLEDLHVANYIQSPESLTMICMNLGKLKTLSLGDCRDLSDADGLMLSRLRRLMTLWVSNASGFEDLALEGGIGGSELKSLTVDESSLTNAGLLSLVGKHGRLKDIKLYRCDNITDQGLKALLTRVPLLEKLRLSCCSSIGSDFIEVLKDCCPRLRYVEVVACATSCRAVDSLQRRRPDVEILYLPSLD